MLLKAFHVNACVCLFLVLPLQPRFVNPKISSSNSFRYRPLCYVLWFPTNVHERTTWCDLRCRRSQETKFMRRHWTQHRTPYVFSPPPLHRGGRMWGAVWLLSPHPQPVRNGFRKKRIQTCNSEITRYTPIKRYTFWDPRAAVSRTDYYRAFYFSFTEEILVWSVWSWGEGIQMYGE